MLQHSNDTPESQYANYLDILDMEQIIPSKCHTSERWKYAYSLLVNASRSKRENMYISDHLGQCPVLVIFGPHKNITHGWMSHVV